MSAAAAVLLMVAVAALALPSLVNAAGASGGASFAAPTNFDEEDQDPMTIEPNLLAFMAMIAVAEGTARAIDPYRVCYGYKHTIASFADHPSVLGTWSGEKLTDAMCKGAGLGPGCVSTAAGKYQIIKPTWEALKSRLSLPDFSPSSQDAACIQLLNQCGARALIRAGDFDGAVSKARRTWASLPGAGYAQPERSMNQLRTAYLSAGGAVA
jgi:muramidase (phage lysozyme)